MDFNTSESASCQQQTIGQSPIQQTSVLDETNSDLCKDHRTIKSEDANAFEEEAKCQPPLGRMFCINEESNKTQIFNHRQPILQYE